MQISITQLQVDLSQLTHPSQCILGIQQRQLVPLQGLDVLHNQTEVFGRLEAEFRLQGRHDVLHRRPGVVFKGLGLAVFQEHFQHVGHGWYAQVAQGECGRLWKVVGCRLLSGGKFRKSFG